MTQLEIKLRLKEDEIIECLSRDTAMQVYQMMHEFNMRWNNGMSYLELIEWFKQDGSICHNFHQGTHTLKNSGHGKTVISDLEWLNRHNIFIYGQRVNVRGNLTDCYAEGVHRYIAPHVTVSGKDDLDRLRHGKPFEVTTWEYIEPLHGDWLLQNDLSIKFTIGDVTVPVSSVTPEIFHTMSKGYHEKV